VLDPRSVETTLDGPIELTIPADSRLLRLVRLVASGLASTAGFDVEQLEDLRIAVDEAVAALLEGGDGSRLVLSFAVDDRAVAMVGHTGRSAEAFDGERLDISRQILDAVCDENELASDGDDIRVRIVMRRT
jgi:serine/threonine-protein kinase RsbW